jgi:hypothetical protein
MIDFLNACAVEPTGEPDPVYSTFQLLHFQVHAGLLPCSY